MLELHVYGPAFDLPSIDVKSLAAIALLRSCFRDGRQKWSLIPSNDPSISPFNELPALKDGTLWVAGFRNIAEYLEDSYGQDASTERITFTLGETAAADSEAYLSFLESRGLPILDLSLYVSSDNYTTLTRPTLSSMLAWPQSWTLPQSLRDEARQRSEHLGLSGLDVDATREKELKKENEGLSAAIPKSLRVAKKSVTSLLGSSAEQSRFRLEAVNADFFEPLEKLLGDKKWFLGDKMTVLDCYAIGLLSMMGVKDMPQPWLRQALQKHPNLWLWTQENVANTFDLASDLHWRSPTARTWLQMARDIIDSIAESIPITIYSEPLRMRTSDALNDTGRCSSKAANFSRKHSFHLHAKRHQNAMRDVIGAVVSTAGVVGILLYKGILTISFPLRRAKPMRQGFGEAGSFLGLG